MNKSVLDCTVKEIMDAFVPESECDHVNKRIAFPISNGKLANECGACGDIEYIDDPQLKSIITI